MKTTFALLTLLTVTGCTSVPKYDKEADATRIAQEVAQIDAERARTYARGAEARAQHEQWLADQHGARYLELHPQTTEEMKRSILAGELIVGMTQSEAWAAIGPLLMQTESDGIGGKWSTFKTTEGEPMLLYFSQDRLVRWARR